MNFEQIEPGVFAITGCVNRHTVVEASANELSANCAQADCCILDLSAIESIDSAGVAWLLLLLQEQQKIGKLLQFKSPTRQFMQLAKLTGVESMLTIIS